MNQIEVIIQDVTSADGIIVVDLLRDDQSLTALLIDMPENPEWLKRGNTIYAVFKETEVSIAKEFSGRISLRNKLPCVIREIIRGQLMTLVSMTFQDTIIQSAITTRSVDMLDLQPRDQVTAMIKANEITLMKKS
jgi:molybdate transport system regulatory protein